MPCASIEPPDEVLVRSGHDPPGAIREAIPGLLEHDEVAESQAA